MTTLRRFLIALVAAIAVSGIASASSILGPINATTSITSTLTDWESGLNGVPQLDFQQFNPALGTLNSVTLDISGSITTDLVVTAPTVATQGTAQTNVQLAIQDPNNLLTGNASNFLDTFPGGAYTVPPNGNSPSDNPTVDFYTSKYSFNLAGGGASVNSGNLTPQNYDSGALQYTLSAILTEFTGTGTVDLNAGTYTTTLVEYSSGNATATQTTSASLTGTVTYNYTAASSSTPEPVTMALTGSALIALGLLRKRLSKS